MDPTPLAMVINLRGQAEKASKTQNMFEKRVGGWTTWEQVQQARVKAVELLNEGGSTSLHLSLLRDACCISLLSLVPPDRVGLIRKLRLGHTLKRREGGWRLDLTKQRDSHKTSASSPLRNTPPTCPLAPLHVTTCTCLLQVGSTARSLRLFPTNSTAC